MSPEAAAVVGLNWKGTAKSARLNPIWLNGDLSEEGRCTAVKLQGFDRELALFFFG